MKKLRLGRTDIEVSEICLGTMTFGEQNSLDDACAQMDYALAHGVNFWDTAEMYPVPPKPETQGRTEDQGCTKVEVGVSSPATTQPGADRGNARWAASSGSSSAAGF